MNILGSVQSILLVQRNDDLAVGVCLERIGLGQLLAQDLGVKSARVRVRVLARNSSCLFTLWL